MAPMAVRIGGRGVAAGVAAIVAAGVAGIWLVTAASLTESGADLAADAWSCSGHDSSRSSVIQSGRVAAGGARADLSWSGGVPAIFPCTLEKLESMEGVGLGEDARSCCASMGRSVAVLFADAEREWEDGADISSGLAGCCMEAAVSKERRFCVSRVSMVREGGSNEWW